MTDGEHQSGATARRGRPRRRPWWQESLLLLAVALVVALLLKTFVVQAFYIPSASMRPGLERDDRILVEKVSSWFGGTPQRGDVVVFEDPGGWLGPVGAAGEETGLDPVEAALSAVGLHPTEGHLVKRVIGVEGDVVACCDDQGRISVNGEPLDEAGYIAERSPNAECDAMNPTCDWTVGPVPEGELFVMGDNRTSSADSSVHLCTDGETDCSRDPFVDVDLVTGKVVAVAWPTDHLRLLERPESFEQIPAAPGARGTAGGADA